MTIDPTGAQTPEPRFDRAGLAGAQTPEPGFDRAGPASGQLPVFGLDPAKLLAVAVEEARAGLAEGGVPIGAALFAADGTVLGRGHNRRVQDGDPSLHAETAAFRNAGRRALYHDTIMVTTLSPCWYCSGLVRQFGIGQVLVGEHTTFSGGHDWLAEHGVGITLLDDPECIGLMTDFIRDQPALWAEDIGVEVEALGGRNPG